MGLFIKTDKEKRLEKEKKLKMEEESIKRIEKRILNDKVFYGKVGHIHQGLSYAGVWGVRNNGKMKFKSSKIRIYDDKILIERNKMVVEYINIKEIFQEVKFEAIIILDNGSGIPIQGSNLELKAFVNVLNSLIDKNKSNTSNIISNKNRTSGNSEDKFDKLIKLGEMHDKGLLSDDEFSSLKQELLSNNEDSTAESEDDIEPSENICKNCGTEVSSDDIFCSECGTQIK